MTHAHTHTHTHSHSRNLSVEEKTKRRRRISVGNKIYVCIFNSAHMLNVQYMNWTDDQRCSNMLQSAAQRACKYIPGRLLALSHFIICLCETLMSRVCVSSLSYCKKSTFEFWMQIEICMQQNKTNWTYHCQFYWATDKRVVAVASTAWWHIKNTSNAFDANVYLCVCVALGWADFFFFFIFK